MNIKYTETGTRSYYRLEMIISYNKLPGSNLFHASKLIN